MSSQARGAGKLEVGAGGSPPGPDSTWESGPDERLAAMETKILQALEANHKLIQEQNEKMVEQENTIQQLQEVVDSRFKELSCKVTGLSKGGMKTPAITKKESEVDEDGSTLEKVEQLMEMIEQKCVPYLELCQTTDKTINEKVIPMLTKLEGDHDLGPNIKSLSEKIEMLLDGETEANKLMESLSNGINQIKEDVANSSNGKSDAKTSEDILKIKSTVEKIYHKGKDDNLKEKIKEVSHDLGDILRNSKDTKDIVKDVREDLEEANKKVDEANKRAIARGRVLDTIEKNVAKKKKANSDSDSSDDERSYNNRSRSSRDGSRERGKPGRSGSANSGVSKTKEKEFENLLTQINSSIEILSNRINKVCPSESIEVTLLPSLAKIEKNVGIMLAGVNGGAGGWSKVVAKGEVGGESGSGTKWTYDDRGKRRETSDGEDSLAKKLKLKKKKRRNSGSSSSDDSDDEKTLVKKDKKDHDEIERQIALIGTAVFGMKEKIDIFVKTNKKSCKTVEDSNKVVLDRVGEMTLGVQVIAENLDNVNDVSKKIESLDGIGSLMDRMASIPKALDKLDNLTGIEERLAMLPNMERSLVNMLQLVTELLGRPTERSERMDVGERPRVDGGGLAGEELEDIQAQLKKMQGDIPKQIAEFGSLVETLHSEMANKVDKLNNKVMDRVGGSSSNPLLLPKLEDILKRIKRIENINSAFGDNHIKMIGTLKSLEKRQKEEMGESLGNPGIKLEGGVSEARLAGLLSAIQPKLDDLYIRVLPTLEEIKASQKNELRSRQKDEERENLREREDKDHIQKILDIVEDLKEERPTSLDRRLSEGLGGGGDMEGVVRLVRKLEQIIQENGGKVDHVLNALVDLRSCTAKEANFGRLEHKLEEAIHGGMGRMEPDLLNKIHSKINNILNNFNRDDKEAKKVLDGVNELRSNSMSDAKALSQVNTALQGMKAAASSHDNKMTTTMSSLEEKIDNIFKRNGEEGENNPLDEILAKREEELVSSVEKMLTKMEDEMYENVEKVVNKVGDNMTKTVGMTEEAIATDLKRIMDKLNSVNTKAGRVAARDAGPSKEEKDETDDENVDKVVTNLSSQMDDVHDMIAGVEERIVTALREVKTTLANHDKHVAGSINKVAVLTSKVIEQMTAIGAKPDASAELAAIEGRLENVIKEERDMLADKLGDGRTDAESTQKLDVMSNKIDKLAKNIARVKYLVDATDEESDGGGGSKKGKKKGKADDANVKIENSLDEAKMEALLGALEKRQGNLFTEGCKSQDKALQELKKSIGDVTKKLGTLEEGVTGVNVCLEEDLSGTGETLADIVKRLENVNEVVLKQTEDLDKMESKMATSAALDKIDGRMATTLALDRMGGKILCKIENSSGISGGGGGGGGGIDENALGEILKKMSQISDPIGEVLKKMSEISDPLGEIVKKVTEMNDHEGDVVGKISEISEKMATSSALDKTFNDMMDALEKVLAGITEIPNDFGSQAAALEENLCVNVTNAVRDANKDNWTYLFNQMDHFEGRLAIVKKYCKYGRVKGGSKGGAEEENDDDEEDTLDTVVKNIHRVSSKLEDLSKAMENGVTAGSNREASPIKGKYDNTREQLSMALLLTEIRKRADTDSVSKLHNDMFKSIHNVQRRLLEEQARLVTKLSEESPPSNVTLLIDCLNKVRQSQATILEGQDKNMTTQSDLNKVLGTVINAIEESHKLLDSKQNKGAGQMVGRFADLCDELAKAVSGILSLTDQAASNSSNSMETLDDMIKKCADIPLTTQVEVGEGRKRPSQVGGRGEPPAKRRSLGPRRPSSAASKIAEKTESGLEDQGEESGDESAADTSRRTSTSKPVRLTKTRRSGRVRASKDEESNDNTEKDSESMMGDEIEIVDEINSGPPMIYKVKDELDEKGEKLKTAGDKDTKGAKKKEEKEVKGGRKK